MSNRMNRRYLPSAMREFGNRTLRAQTRFRGPYPDWASALAATTGYEVEMILQRVASATARALVDPCVYEQDGTPLPTPAPPSHALPALMLAAARNRGSLSVLDYGGGLASSFLRWCPILDAIPDLHWHVVEQARFVEAGRPLFANLPTVEFHDSIVSVRDRNPNAALPSSVLQYLQDPIAARESIVALGCGTLIVDPTLFSVSGGSHILAQHVPASMGNASYPCWALPEAKFAAVLSRAYRKLSDFDAPDLPLQTSGIRATYRGLIWMRRS